MGGKFVNELEMHFLLHLLKKVCSLLFHFGQSCIYLFLCIFFHIYWPGNCKAGQIYFCQPQNSLILWIVKTWHFQFKKNVSKIMLSKKTKYWKNSGHFSIYYIKSFDLVTCDLATVFVETKSVTKSRLHCTMKQIVLN